MDMRSFGLNMEISMLVRGEEFVSEVRAVEDEYRRLSRELTLEEWEQQPLRSHEHDRSKLKLAGLARARHRFVSGAERATYPRRRRGLPRCGVLGSPALRCFSLRCFSPDRTGRPQLRRRVLPNRTLRGIKGAASGVARAGSGHPHWAGIPEAGSIAIDAGNAIATCNQQRDRGRADAAGRAGHDRGAHPVRRFGHCRIPLMTGV